MNSFYDDIAAALVTLTFCIASVSGLIAVLAGAV
jgi:hypothetical protein